MLLTDQCVLSITDDARTMLENLQLDKELKTPQVYEQNRMLGYLGVLKTANLNGRDKWHLTSTEVAQLIGLREEANDRAANWISNLLCVGYGTCRPPATGGDTGAPKSRRTTSTSSVAEKDFDFTIAPNPADAWVTFSYRLPAGSTSGYVVIKDGAGRRIAEQPLQGPMGQVVHDTRNMGAGIYSIQYVVAGKTLQTDKLIVK